MNRLDPQQVKFLQYYLDFNEETFSNAYQSAVKAGYSDEYAKTITFQLPKWLSENLDGTKMLNKAESNLDNLLDSDDARIKLDSTKFVASRLCKVKWSERT